MVKKAESLEGHKALPGACSLNDSNCYNPVQTPKKDENRSSDYTTSILSRKLTF
jgi:hypothetical protein